MDFTSKLLLRRTIGLALILMLFIGPLIIGGAGGVSFVIALFAVFPGPLMTMPYLVMAFYLSSSKKPRIIDIVVIIVCVMLLLILLSTAAFVTLIFFLPLIIFGTPFGLLLIPVLIVVLVVILRRRKRGMKAHKLTPTQPALFACPHCGRDLSAFPRDMVLCPYCGKGLAHRTCSGCGRDLSQFPTDIRNCPYCGKAVTIREVEAMPVKPVEVKLPESVQRIRRHTKNVALLGLLIAVLSFILGPFLGGLKGPEHTYVSPILHEYRNEIGNGAIVGILIAIFSSIVRVIAGSLALSQIARSRELALRWILGVAMIVLLLIHTFFGMHWFVDWYAPGLLIAICLLIPKKYSMKASIILLALVLIFAFWPRDIGPFGPALSDTWLMSIALSPEVAQWGLGQIVNFWTLLCEKVLAIIAGMLLVAKKI